jgi:DNA repair protein SbcC/Rad50
MLNIASWFKRKQPLWQQKDADARATGVAQSADPKLIEQLPEIARNDPDAQVRLRAIKRIDGLETLRAIADGDTDAAVRQAAKDRLIADLKRGGDGAERLAIVRAAHDRTQLEALAKDAHHPNVRWAALQQLNRAAAYKNAAMHDADPALRRRALAEIRDANALKAIIEAARKTDKALSREAASALEALKLKAGDPAALRERALKLCQALEDLVRRVERDEAPVLKLREDWRALGEIGDAALKQRFDGALKTLRETIDAPQLREEARAERVQARADIINTLERLATEANDDLDLEAQIGGLDQLIGVSRAAWAQQAAADLSDTERARYDEAAANAQARLVALVAERPADPKVAALSESIDALAKRRGHAQRDIDAFAPQIQALRTQLPDSASNRAALGALDARLQAMGEKLKESAALAQSLALSAEGWIDELMAALERGDSRQALEIDQRIFNAQNKVKPAQLAIKPAARKRLDEAEAQLAELKKWRGWSQADARTRLIEDAEALKAAGLHPDALEERARELRDAWRKLESRKPEEAKAQRAPFDAAIDAALAPAKAYLDKRNALQNQRLASSRELLEQLQNVPAEIPDFNALRDLIKLGRDEQRQIDALPPKARGKHARALRDALDALAKRLDAHFDELGEQRETLIRAAENLAQHADVRHAIAQSKALNERWKAIKGLPRKRDQGYWERFRAAIDGIYARANSERDQARAAEAELNQRESALMERIRAFDATAADAASALAALRAEVHANGASKLDAAIDRADAKLHDAQENAARAERDARVDTLIHKLTQRRNGALIDTPTEPEWDDALAHQAPREPATALAQTLLIELELITALPSPDSDADERMALNLGRLKKRMRGELRDEPARESHPLIARYLEIEIEPTLAAALDARLAAVLKRLGGAEARD